MSPGTVTTTQAAGRTAHLGWCKFDRAHAQGGSPSAPDQRHSHHLTTDTGHHYHRDRARWERPRPEWPRCRHSAVEHAARRPEVAREFGDEANRYATPKCRKNYAGTSPITRASGTKQVVLARHVRNRRLADAIYLWASASLTASPGARACYDARRAAGAGHHQALRPLGNRLVGILHGCLAHHTAYNETIAWVA
jgi:hypothetical protein